MKCKISLNATISTAPLPFQTGKRTGKQEQKGEKEKHHSMLSKQPITLSKLSTNFTMAQVAVVL